MGRPVMEVATARAATAKPVAVPGHAHPGSAQTVSVVTARALVLARHAISSAESANAAPIQLAPIPRPNVARAPVCASRLATVSEAVPSPSTVSVVVTVWHVTARGLARLTTSPAITQVALVVSARPVVALADAADPVAWAAIQVLAGQVVTTLHVVALAGRAVTSQPGVAVLAASRDPVVRAVTTLHVAALAAEEDSSRAVADPLAQAAPAFHMADRVALQAPVVRVGSPQLRVVQEA